MQAPQTPHFMPPAEFASHDAVLIERLLWNVEVLRDAVGADLDIVSCGDEWTDDPEHPGLVLTSKRATPQRIAACANELQRLGRMDRGAVYLYVEGVYVDIRGRPVRGFGTEEYGELPTVELPAGLDIRTLYSDTDDLRVPRDLIERPRQLASSRDELAPSKKRSKKSSSALALPTGTMVKIGVATVGVAAVGAVGFLAYRKLKGKK